MENKTIKKEIEDEVNDFIKSVENTPMLTKEQIEKLQLFDKNTKVPFSSTHSEQALRYNQGKLKWSLVDWKSLEGLVEVLQYGADKYTIFQDNEGNKIKGIDIMNIPDFKNIYDVAISGENNWKKGLELDSILDSAMRHIVKMMNNEFVDEESKLLHAHHVICNMMFWVYFYNKK